MADLTPKQKTCAEKLALADDTDDAIAAGLGITPVTLWRWKQIPEFQAAVSAHIEELGRKLSRYHIARKDKRMAEYDRRWQAIRALRTARAADMANVPGGESGLLVRSFKQIGGGPLATMVEEYASDTALLQAQLALEKQAAQEAGQWADKREISGADGGPVRVQHELDMSGLSDEELLAIVNRAPASSG